MLGHWVHNDPTDDRQLLVTITEQWWHLNYGGFPLPSQMQAQRIVTELPNILQTDAI